MLGYVDRKERKIESLNKIVELGKGEYVDEAMYELGRTYISLEKYAEASKVLKNFTALYVESPNYIVALTDLGLISQNLGNEADALSYYKKVVALQPNSLAAKDAMTGIRVIYVKRNEV